MSKRLFLSILIIIGLALFVFILYRLLRPEKPVYATTEVERVFPGEETVFVESRGLRDAWNIFKRSDYYREKGYAPLLTLPVLDELSREVGGMEGDIGRDVSFDIFMYLLGLESAVGLYMSESDIGGFDYLVVSRVYPEILFMERLATFFAGERYVTESRYRGLKVKEIVIDYGGEEDWDEIHKIVYTIHGDLLILAGNEELFYAAADRHLDGGSGGLSEDERFISAREKVDNLERTCIFGFVDSGGMVEIPVASEVLSGMGSYLSYDLLLFGAQIDGYGRVGDDSSPGEIMVGLETRSGGSRDAGRSRGGLSTGGFGKSEISGDELVMVVIHDLSILPVAVLEESSPSKELLLLSLFDLFFDGFTVAVVQGDRNCPALAAWGKSPPGAMKIITEVAVKNGLNVIESETGNPGVYSVVETGTFEPELMAFTFYGKMIFIANSAAMLAPLIERVEEGRTFRLSLKNAVLSMFGERERGITLIARPGPVWKSMKACPSAFEGLSASLYPSPDNDVPFLKRYRFIKGLYPIREVAVGILPTDGGIMAEIRIKVDDDAEGGGTR